MLPEIAQVGRVVDGLRDGRVAAVLELMRRNQLHHWSIPGFMHTLFRVTGVLSGVESSVVLGLGFCGWASVKAVYKPAFVVPAHPRGGHVLQVGEGVDRPGAKRGTLADTLGLFTRRIRQ